MSRTIRVITLTYNKIVPESSLCPAMIELLKIGDGGVKTCECGRRVECNIIKDRLCLFVAPVGERRLSCDSITFISKER